MATKTESKPKFSITKTVFKDIPEVRTLQAKIWNDTYPNESAGVGRLWIKKLTESWLTPEALEGSKEFMGPKIIDPNNFHRIVRIKGEICGFLHASKDAEGQTLGAIYIDKKYHSSGMAKELMDLAMNWFDKSKDITLEVADYNDRAITFYKKYGFEIEKNSKHIFADKIPTVNMIRKGDKV